MERRKIAALPPGLVVEELWGEKSSHTEEDNRGKMKEMLRKHSENIGNSAADRMLIPEDTLKKFQKLDVNG